MTKGAEQSCPHLNTRLLHGEQQTDRECLDCGQNWPVWDGRIKVPEWLRRLFLEDG